jgi:2-octaprenyl-6-methoxyphenol hydroxylase
MQHFTHNYDVIIIGGGLSGLTLAVSLAQQNFSIAVIDRTELSTIIATSSDGRCSAITLGSSDFFKTINLWPHLVSQAGPICDIRVTDGDSKAHVHFNHNSVSSDPMGYIIPNHVTLKGLKKLVDQQSNIDFFCTDNYHFEQQANCVTVAFDDQTLKGSLLVAADGRHSQLRKRCGIGSLKRPYNQTGIVCNIRHEKPHHALAHERFLPTGPFASLPLNDPHESSLVWTEKPELAELYLKMNTHDFAAAIEKRLCHHLGDAQVITERFAYPLTLVLAEYYLQGRILLLGDAAHGIHPLAGQGFNLGIRDIITLTPILTEVKSLGLDIGANGALQQYEKLRYVDSLSMAAATDGLNQLFLHNWLPIKIIRRLGLRAVNQSDTLKKSFMRHAMGLSSPGAT